MFDFFRRMIIPIILIALIGFLATIIFSWGMDITRRQQFEDTNLAALINGEEVSWQDYNRIYDNLYQAEQMKTDDELTDNKKKELQESAWNQILFERLMMQEVAKHNITVSDNELYSYLRMTPPAEFQQASAFQTNGKFDYQKYLNALADPNYTQLWISYDPIFRAEIKKLKLQEMIIQSAHVAENEIQEYFISTQEKVKVGLINIGYGRFSNPSPKVTDEEIKNYYEENKANYDIEERASLNLVLIEKKPSPTDWEAIYNQSMVIYDSIIAGADFAETAKIYSQDGSASKGGDLGWFQKGQMVEEFDKRVFGMQKGEVSAPIRTQFGWHIIKNFGFKEELEVPRGKTEKEKVKKVQASHILLKVVPSQETLDKANNRLTEFHAQALNNGFLKAAEDLKFSVVNSSLFFEGKNMQYLGNDPVAGAFAFENEVDAISEVSENLSVQYVAQVAERKPAGLADFEDVSNKVRLDLVKNIVKTQCIDTSAAIWADIQSGTSFKKAAKNHGEEYEETIEFKRDQFVPNLSRDPITIGTAFSLQKPGDLSGPVDYSQGTIIMKLISRTPVDLTEFTAKKDSIATIILGSKQQELFGRWIEKLRDDAVIVNNIQKTLTANREY